MTESVLLEPTGVRHPRLGRLISGPAPAWATLAAVGAGVALVGAVDPSEPGHYPLCPVNALTGLYCPGCGALRATHALAQGDVGAAVGLNVLFVLVLPFLAGAWLLWVRRLTFGRPRRLIAPAWAIWAFLAVEVTFTVLRNLPWFAVLAP